MDDLTERVRRRAYQIWLDEGRPEGREAAHWDMASELVAIEDGQTKTTKPVGRDPENEELAATAPAEPAAPAAAMGELPTMTDAGEQTYPPSRAAEKAAGSTPAARESVAANPVAKPPAKPEIRPEARKSEPVPTSRPGSSRK